MDNKTLDIIKKKLGRHKQVGKELKVQKCPYCGRDKWKFYFNTENGKFVCHSGSCNERGTILKLKFKLGLKVDFKESISNQVKQETVLNITPQEQKEFHWLKHDKLDWFNKRGISEETLKYMKVCEFRGAIAFPYFQENELKMLKFRDMKVGKDKKVWQHKGGTSVLWGLDKIDFEQPVILAEGEPDMLSWIEAGYKNVVSVPFGTGDMNWIDNNIKEIEKMQEIYLSFDDDAAGRKAEQEVISRLGTVKFKKINKGTYSDINDALRIDGKDKLIEFYEHAEDYKIDGYYYGSEIDINVNIPDSIGLLPEVDKLTAGFEFGDLTIWSAYTGNGKTTILTQLMLNSLAQNQKCLYYTGEDAKEDLQTILALQLYGEGGVKKIWHNRKQKHVSIPTEETNKKLKKEIRNRLVYVEDEFALSNKQLFEKMNNALIKDGIRIFVIDNLMQVDIEGDYGHLEKQKRFTRDLVRFARKHKVQIHLVAHLKKPKDGTKKSVYEVAGSSDIVNLAQMVINITKISGKRKEEIFNDTGKEVECAFTVLKKRKRFAEEGTVYLRFDKEYTKFYDLSMTGKEKLSIVKEEYTDDDFPDWS